MTKPVVDFSALCCLLLLLLSASPYSGRPQREIIFHLTLSTSSPSLTLTLSMSSLAKSIHLLLRLPLFLLPGTATFIILFPTYYSSLLFTCPYQRSHAFRSLSPRFAIFDVLLTYSFHVLSFLVTPCAHLAISNSATFIFPTCLCVTSTVSMP